MRLTPRAYGRCAISAANQRLTGRSRRAGARLTRAAARAICLAGLFAAMTCALLAGKARAADSVELTVSGAASLKDALTAITSKFEQAHTNIKIALNFGASGTLEMQIERGAPVDVFVAASPDQMDALASRKLLLDDTRLDLLQNELVLIVPRSPPRVVAAFRDLARPEVRVVALGDPLSVPAGKYAQQTLTALGIYEAVKKKATFATDVRQVLADVETGSADAGLVYATDAGISPRVRVVATAPRDTHDPIVYPAAVLRTVQGNPDKAAAARAYLGFLKSADARAIFARYGFRPIEAPARN